MVINKMTRRFLAFRSLTWWGAWLALVIILLAAPAPAGQENSPFVVLSGDFFEALQKLRNSGVTYGDRQGPLLEQIALSSQYIVKTNLTLIQQNEKVIHLLEELNRKRLLQDR